VSNGKAIVVSDLSKRYGERVAVDHLSFSVFEGEVFGFLGPNGAGKSSTLKMLCGFMRPTSGEALVAGLSPIRDRNRLKQAIGFMPQAFGLYDYLTVRENLEFYGNLYLSSRKEVLARTREVLGIAGLDPYLNQQASRLSAGWRQRLALACSILHRPRVLFLDEPTAGVDPVSRRLFWDLIHKLNDSGTTIFVTTHHMEELERCHRVGLLHQGRLKLCGSPDTLRAITAGRFQLLALDCPDPERILELLRAAPNVKDAYLYGRRIHLAFPIDYDGAGATLALLDRVGVAPWALEPRVPTMEDVFVTASEIH
jgi:ABC-2 type transport system ATP-binding protein